MRYAIIQDNKVINIAVADKSFAKEQGWIPLTEGVSIGWTYKNKKFFPPERDIETEWNNVKIRRDDLLKQSDIYVLPDLWESMTEQEKQVWTDYRQTLRDIPQTFDDPAQVVWPTLPVV